MVAAACQEGPASLRLARLLRLRCSSHRTHGSTELAQPPHFRLPGPARSYKRIEVTGDPEARR